MKYRVLVLSTLFLALAGFSAPASAQDFGKALKGSVLFAGKEAPKREKLNVDKDQNVCLHDGPLLSQEWLVNEKNLGIKNVFVWLEPVKADAKMPIAPALKENKVKQVVIDQPNCQFHPDCLAIREGTVIVVKNPAPIQHNFRWTPTDPAKGAGGNVNMIPKSQFEIKDLKADSLVLVKCDIHGWMSGYIRVYDHPYFALTDENGKFEIPDPPAGKYILKVWHPASGWGIVDGKKMTKYGTPIAIEVGGVTEAPKITIAMTP